MLAQIAEIVATARAERGLSLPALAEKGGIPLESLVALEGGMPAISTVELGRIADVLELDPYELIRGRRVERMTSVFLRHLGTHQDFHHSDLGSLEKALSQGRLLVGLRKLLGEQPGLWLEGPFRHVEAGDAAAREGYRLARAVRRWLERPFQAVPNACALVENEFGVAVVVRNLTSTRISAVSIRSTDGAAVILNEADPERRRNPTLARVHLLHELCHVLFDPSDGGVHVVIDSTDDRRGHRAEQRARGFAAEFLLPLAGLKRKLGERAATRSPEEAVRLVERARAVFHTPHEIAAHHLCNMGFIHEDLHDWVTAAGSRSDAFITPLPETGWPSKVVRALVREAHDEGLITDGEARNALWLDTLMPLPWDRGG